MPNTINYVTQFETKLRDLYGQELEVVLTDFLRGEKKFDSLETLQLQLRSDIAVRRQISNVYHHSDT